ncbi:MAG: BatD family protein [Gammaproteobacteria bacterium]
MVATLKTILAVLLFGLLAGFAANASASNATLQVDQTSVEKDQTVTAVFTYKGKLNSEPDFSALETDFSVISQGVSKSVEIINGNYREQQTWNTILLSKREGQVEIPAIKFGNEFSNAVTLTVSPAKPGNDTDLGDLFLETELTPESGGYVQQQHMFTVRIYFRGWLIDGQLSDPEINNQDVVVQSLGEPRRYSVTRNGERYQVYERRHALFPQASGELVVGETTFSGRLRLPVGGNRLKSVSTPALTRTVKPVPAAFTGDVWLPAESLTITEVWPADKLVFEQGVPITRTISIGAVGLTSAQLPALQLEGNESVRVYPDQPSAGDQIGEKGVVGTRAVAVAMVPQKSGEVRLPPLEIKWWDTTADRERVARLDAKTLSVIATAGSVQTDSESNVVQESAPSSVYRNPWFFATLICALGWLLTWFMRPRKQEFAHEEAPVTNQSANVQQRLRGACNKNDAKSSAHFLSEFLRLEANAGRQDWLNRPQSAELKRQWHELNRCLYGPASERDSWQAGSDLWRAFDQATGGRPKVEKATGRLAELAPSA